MGVNIRNSPLSNLRNASKTAFLDFPQSRLFPRQIYFSLVENKTFGLQLKAFQDSYHSPPVTSFIGINATEHYFLVKFSGHPWNISKKKFHFSVLQYRILNTSHHGIREGFAYAWGWNRNSILRHWHEKIAKSPIEFFFSIIYKLNAVFWPRKGRKLPQCTI